MRKRIYISGPITSGDRNWNQYQANCIHKQLLLAGYAVLNPMPTGVLPFAWDGSVDHAIWLDSDLAFVSVCHVVLRLPGDSQGADQECDFALEQSIPVVHAILISQPNGAIHLSTSTLEALDCALYSESATGAA